MTNSPPEPFDVESFAGPGGWSVAARLLGLDPLGIEWDATACATARAAGHRRVEEDVSALWPAAHGKIRLKIDSPPCTAYSAAGKGNGRAAIPVILKAVEMMGQGHDPHRVVRDVTARVGQLIALVLEPLRWAIATDPETICLEQVPPVLPLWAAIAKVLEARGYSVWHGLLTAERYDVGQTRKRAILIASRVVEVSCPPPVRRKYVRGLKQHEGDQSLSPWLSMRDVIKRGMTQRPSYTITSGGVETGGAEPIGNGGRKGMMAELEKGDWEYINGNQTNSARRPIDLPAPTVHFGARSNKVDWRQRSNYNHADTGDRTRRTLDEPSVTLTGRPPQWEATEPPKVVRVSVEEAALLQGFPVGYPWQGSRSQQYQQVGNAVPPPLAWHVLRAALGLPVEHYPDHHLAT